MSEWLDQNGTRHKSSCGLNPKPSDGKHPIIACTCGPEWFASQFNTWLPISEYRDEYRGVLLSDGCGSWTAGCRENGIWLDWDDVMFASQDCFSHFMRIRGPNE